MSQKTKEETNEETNENKSPLKTQLKVACYTREIEGDAEFDPDLLDSCVYGNLITRNHGSPDYKGRYMYSYRVFINDKDGLRQLKNQDLFNENFKIFEEILNTRVQQEFEGIRPEFLDCFEDFQLRHYTLNDFGIALNPNGSLNFNLSFGLPGVCMAADGLILTYPITELQPYLATKFVQE